MDYSLVPSQFGVDRFQLLGLGKLVTIHRLHGSCPGELAIPPACRKNIDQMAYQWRHARVKIGG